MDKYKVIGSKMIHTQTEEECADITARVPKPFQGHTTPPGPPPVALMFLVP